jgi:hypothetical protein
MCVLIAEFYLVDRGFMPLSLLRVNGLSSPTLSSLTLPPSLPPFLPPYLPTSLPPYLPP